MKSYDMTEMQLHASNCQEMAESIAADIDTAIFDGTKPKTGTWKQIEKRLDEAADTLWQIRQDISGDH